MSVILLVRTTFGDADSAGRIARTMIEERLAACASLSAARSLYRWKGTVESEDETAVLFKTTLDRGGALKARIARLHDYDLPVIEAWEATVGPDVAEWIYSETGAE